MMIGATVVNFSQLYTAEELERQVADSQTRLLVTLDVTALLPTAAQVHRESELEWLVVCELARMLPWWQGIGLRLFRRKDIVPAPSAANVLRWRDLLAEGEPSPEIGRAHV